MISRWCRSRSPSSAGRSVREGGSARRCRADGGDDERGDQDSRRRGAVECAPAARRHCRPALAPNPARSTSCRRQGSFRRCSTADMLLNSTFPAGSLERLRAQRLVALAQARAQPGTIAARVFPRVLYGPVPVRPGGHRGLDQGDFPGRHRGFPTGLFQTRTGPDSVVGDVRRRPSARRWKGARGLAAGGEKPTFTYPEAPQPKATTIYLVDKPGAAQSTFAIGSPGPSRSTPDYALEVMNTILGGQFQSRLNANIREYRDTATACHLLSRSQRPRRVPRRRQHDGRQDRRGARRIHEGVARHRRSDADHKRGTDDGPEQVA